MLITFFLAMLVTVMNTTSLAHPPASLATIDYFNTFEDESNDDSAWSQHDDEAELPPFDKEKLRRALTEDPHEKIKQERTQLVYSLVKALHTNTMFNNKQYLNIRERLEAYTALNITAIIYNTLRPQFTDEQLNAYCNQSIFKNHFDDIDRCIATTITNILETT